MTINISQKLNIPVSTIKWNLRVLRDLGLITAGSKENKKIKVGLTKAGIFIAKRLFEHTIV
ncbi:MAG: hypothetical protein NDF53_02800 [archaeon GB-1867-097]|nr:hypothetical protein [Candidatus Culexmicrobium thermophilum]